ncbi:MAG TPA: hypothetical protein DDX72_08315 [Ruminococcaceae bacterium]|nr:hypothetical protein [Oscillospiraceae bacterium]
MNDRVIPFLKKIRDYTAYIFSWLTIIILIVSFISGNVSISALLLARILLLSAIAAVSCTVAFTRTVIRRKGFLFRINLFALVFIPAEIAVFYRIGIFAGTGTPVQWLIFFGVILFLYIVSVGIGTLACRKEGRSINNMLDNYKKGRNKNYGEQNI